MESTEYINYEYFSKVNLKVGKILEVSDIAGKDKLYLIKVDVGEETPRTLFAGIKKYYKKEDLLNKLVVVVANLEPKKMGAITSEGMLLAAAKIIDGNETLSLVTLDSEIDLGTNIM